MLDFERFGENGKGLILAVLIPVFMTGSGFDCRLLAKPGEYELDGVVLTDTGETGDLNVGVSRDEDPIF